MISWLNENQGILISVATLAAILIATGVVFGSLGEYEDNINSLKDDCMSRFNISDEDLVLRCAVGTRTLQTLDNTGSMNLRGVVIVIAIAALILGAVYATSPKGDL